MFLFVILGNPQNQYMDKRIFKYIKRTIFVLLSIYFVGGALLYFFQEKMLFHPESISKSTKYSYDSNFEEKFYTVEKGVELNTLLFSTDSIKENRKLIFYIHGNGGTLKTLGSVATSFTNRGYDCFMYDYRGYGKSDGVIDSEAKLFSDAQILYNQMKQIYAEEDIVIVGYSIGTGIASWLASKKAPNKLILEAPYFSMKDMMRRNYPIVPTVLLRYPLESDKYLKETNCPIFIFHGDQDSSIPFSSSQNLKKLHPKIEMTRLSGVGHTGFAQNQKYQKVLTEILRN